MRKILKYIFIKLNIYHLYLQSLKNSYISSTNWRHSIYNHTLLDPNGNPTPWISYNALSFFNQILTKDANVLEFGSGSSSLFFASKTKSVHSVEHDAEWFTEFRKNKQIPSNCSISLIPIEKHEYVNFANKFDFLFDIIFIDGRKRVDCAKLSFNRLSNGGFIIIDNTERERYIEADAFLKSQGFSSLVFSGLTPLVAYETKTSFYFKTSQANLIFSKMNNGTLANS